MISWKTTLIRSEEGKMRVRGSAGGANAVTILVNDPRWAGVLAYDEFAETIVTLKPAPWRLVDAPKVIEPGDWTDEDTARAQYWLSDSYHLELGESHVLNAVKTAAHKNRVHPVREWLDSLRWDGRKRVPTWLVDVMGCEDTPYVRAVGQAWFISAIARAYRPGCKVDTVLVLEGKPGIFKSSVLRAIVGDPWFLEMSITDVSNKDAMQVLKRKWIAEFPEIDGLSRSEQAHVKAYFSRQVDTYRASYGRGSRDFPRQTVFAATTNKNEYLVDETGGSGRRMWPVQCRQGDLARAQAMREQLWAEARARFESKEEWHIRDPELRDAEREEQEARLRSDPWEFDIAKWLSKPVDAGRPRAVHGVTTSDVLACVGVDIGKRTHAEAIRVGAILRKLGWVPSKNKELRDSVRVRVYRPEGEVQEGEAGSGIVPIPPPADPEDEESMFPPKWREAE